MAPRKPIRITPTNVHLETAIKGENHALLEDWLELSTKDLEYRLRYSKTEETQILQGALRILDDIKSIIS